MSDEDRTDKYIEDATKVENRGKKKPEPPTGSNSEFYQGLKGY